MQIFLAPGFKGSGDILLSVEESKHCTKVLRHKRGDVINVINGKGDFFTAELFDINPECCKAKVVSTKKIGIAKNYRLHIAISPTKNPDRIEWMVEKCTEMGVDEFSFVVGKRTEKPTVKLERLQKILESAVKQSIQGIIPEINDAVPFKEFVAAHKDSSAKKYIAYCGDEKKTELKSILSQKEALVLIGPEGDFTPEEIKLALENGFEALSLGEARLRTETAGLFVGAAFKTY
ncbi:MAG: RsmE family RNA methyltransferase [Bacteroidia bacterium]